MNMQQNSSLALLDLEADQNGDLSIRDIDGNIIVKIPRNNHYEDIQRKAELIYKIFFKYDFFVHEDNSELSEYFNISVKLT